MLTNHISPAHQNYAYRFIVGPQTPPTQLFSFGWQVQNKQDYYFDGRKRKDELGNCILQYTISGSGMFEINGKRHLLKEGMAFLSDIPSDHCYYLPKDGVAWEFIYITLSGPYAVAEWRKIQDQFGNILYLTDQDEIIQYFWKIYLLATQHEIKDGYTTSAIAYQFIMHLWNHLVSQTKEDPSANRSMDTAINYMKTHYHKPITLDDIASSIGLSRFHFNRIFVKTNGISPWKYLTKLRMEAAADLLLTTKLTNENISKLCGYDSSNYFDKVFRKYVGMSPGKFRQSYHSIDHFKLKL